MKKKILIYGMGKTGAAVKKFCIKKNIPYETYDDKKQNPDKFKNLLEKISTIVLSPGVPASNGNIKLAIKTKINVISEIEFASRYIDKPLIAITGTNGKTTTCLLTYNLLKSQKKRIFLGGNIGKPLVSSLNDAKTYDLYLVECSSFQLQFIDKSFRPFISLITNLSPNHLDHHNSLREYYDSKFNIFKNQFKSSFYIEGEKLKNQKIKLLKRKKINIISLNLNQDKKYLYYDNLKIDKNKLNVIGNHNYKNIISALKILSIYTKVDKSHLEILYKFNPPNFRLEKVSNQPKIYNDSKSTSPAATLKALESFNEKVYLIIGGKDKNLDYSELLKVLAKRTKGIFIFGQNKFKLAKYFYKFEYEICSDLRNAVELCIKKAGKKDIILFSPGTSSFDSYKSYNQRGEVFNSYVRQFS